MLKLVTDNTNKENNNNAEIRQKTCRNNCVLFNDKTNSCPIFKGLNYNDPTVVKRCLEFNDVDEAEGLYHNSDYKDTVVTLIEENFSVDADMDFMFGLTGKQNSQNQSKYPYEPDIPFHERMDGLYWYTSPDESFGCWIKNDCKKPFGIIPTSKDKAKKGWAKNIYASPIPLHDHEASQSLKTRMCWYVDKDGWGQYTVIIANKIKFITFPKPNKW